MRRGNRLILLFFWMSMLGATWQFWMSIGIPLGSRYYVLLQFLALPVLVLATLQIRASSDPLPHTNSHTFRATLFLIYVILMFGYGILRGNSLVPTIAETWIYVVFVMFLLISRYDWIWEALEKPMLVFFWICFLLVVIGLSRPMITGASGIWMEADPLYGERAEASSVGARIASMLELWPLLFALAFFKRKNDFWRILGLGTILAYLAIAVIMQFRSRFMIVFIYLGMILVVIPMLQKRLKLGTGVLVIILIGAGYFCLSMTTSYAALMQRFEQTRNWENRRNEIEAMVSQMDPVQCVIGKGMGGTYRIATDWSAGEYIGGYDHRRIMHAGGFVPFLKGGFILLVLYYPFYLRFLFRKPWNWYNNRFNIASMAVLPVYLLYLQMVPPPGLVAFPFMVMAGMACARMAAPVVTEDPLGEYYQDHPYESVEQYNQPIR